MENEKLIEGVEQEVVAAEPEEAAEVVDAAEVVAEAPEVAVEATEEITEAETVAEAQVNDGEATAAEAVKDDKYIIQQPSKIDPKKKKFYKKWWFWVIVVVLVGVISVGAIAIADSSSSSSGGSSGYVPTVNPYVSMVKNAVNSNYGVSYGVAFENFFSNTSWDHFVASTGENVVEFEGDFSYDNSPATATIQFVINATEGTFTVYHLSINGVAQNKLMLATLVQKVFESASSYSYY